MECAKHTKIVSVPTTLPLKVCLAHINTSVLTTQPLVVCKAHKIVGVSITLSLDTLNNCATFAHLLKCVEYTQSTVDWEKNFRQ